MKLSGYYHDPYKLFLLSQHPTSANSPNLYCKFGNFRENFIFAKNVKRQKSDTQNSRLRHDLHVLVNSRLNLLFREGFFSRNFAYAKFRENKTLAKISEFTVMNIYDRIPINHFCDGFCLLNISRFMIQFSFK